mgnify:CR=1 FL=1
MKIQLVSVTRSIQSFEPSANEKVHTVATHYRGDPVFDTCEQEGSAYRDKMQLMLKQKNGLPKNFLGISSEGTTLSGTQLSRQVTAAFTNFYCGQIDNTALEHTLSSIVADLRVSYINKGYNEAEFMPQLIEDVYSCARINNIHGAGTASWYDGQSFAIEHNGHNNNTADWIYYNADYYYKSEETKKTLQKFAQNQAVKYGVDPSVLNLPIDYPNNDIRKGIYSSYNTFQNSRIRDVGSFGNIIDETMPPPMGLRFFYKSNEAGTDRIAPKLSAPRDEPEALFDGVLRVWYKDWSFIGRVPVRQNPNKFPISVNTFDIVSRSSTSAVPEEITGFLRNIDFFTLMMGEAYKGDNPRQL